MIIHVVRHGETLEYIADKYQISAERLILENGITNPDNLVAGQTIVVVYPLINYTVEEGESLPVIADKFNVTVLELLRNNPYLSDREQLYPGETIVISYDTVKNGHFSTNGYAYSFINRDILRKTLPFLTYLTILNYRITLDGTVIDIDDTELIDMAKAYGVAPIMLLSTLSEMGTGSCEVMSKLIENPLIQDILFDDTINKMKDKGYYGINVYLQFLRQETLVLTEEYIKRFSKRVKEEGLLFMITVTSQALYTEQRISFEQVDYSTLLEYVDGILFLSYDWAYSFNSPSSLIPLSTVREIYNQIVTLIPPGKLLFGMPVIGYDWSLPYIPGYTVARAITNDAAIELAAISEVSIEFNEIMQAPYYYYTNRLQELHIVWFKDARSITVMSKTAADYRLQGLSIWNIMRFFAQMWFIINTQYEIDKIPVASFPDA